MRLTRLDLFFWAAGFVLDVTLLGILWYRRRFRTFPCFTAIMALTVAKTMVLYLVRRWGSVGDYFVVYWSLVVADTCLQLCVVYEVASKVFRPVNVWAVDVRQVFGWSLGLSLAAALGLAWMASPPAHSQLEALTTKGNLFADALMSELFVAMMVISFTAGLPWRSHAGAIAQGLGGYSLISVLIEAGHTYFGVGRDMALFVVLYQVRMVAYLGCVFYWIVNLSSEEQPARTMTGEMRATLVSLQTQIAGDLRSVRFRKTSEHS